MVPRSKSNLRLVSSTPPSGSDSSVHSSGIGSPELAATVTFGPFTLDRRDLRLIGPEGPIRLGNKAYRVLEELIAARGRLVTKTELLDRVWERKFVSESAMTSAIKELRKALSDSSRQPRYIESSYGKGYRFLGEIDALPEVEDIPAPIQPSPVNGNLPHPVSPLIGRQTELAALAKRLKQGKLVSIVGPGGVGKSRLALEVARNLTADWSGGAWQVELATVEQPGAIAEAIAAAMDIQITGDENWDQALIDALRCSACLLILDNCEHLVDGAAAMTETILKAAPGVTLLCTSQEPLTIDGEQVFRLEPLTEAAARTLFAERVHAIDASFRDDEHRTSIEDICRRLDCMPLAIEMAAARVPAMGCAEVLRLLDDRFSLLARGWRGAAERQRSLHAALDWSHSLLPSEEARMFRRLAVFPGSFSKEAAAHIAGDPDAPLAEALSALQGLIDRSLVSVRQEADGRRYLLLQTMRAFALEKLQEADEEREVQDRFVRYFADLTSPVWDVFCGVVSDAELHRRFGIELDNMRRAMDWAFGTDGNAEAGQLLVARSSLLWRGRERILLPYIVMALHQVSAATPAHLAALLHVAHAMALVLVQPQGAKPVAERAVKAARDASNELWPLCYALCAQGMAHWLAGDLLKARAISDELQSLVVRETPSRAVSLADSLEAIVLAREGKIEAATELSTRTAQAMQAIGANGSVSFWQSVALRMAPYDDLDQDIEEWRAIFAGIGPDVVIADEAVGTTVAEFMSRLLERGRPEDVTEAADVACSHLQMAPGAVDAELMMQLAKVSLKMGQAECAALLVGHAVALARKSVKPEIGAVDPTQLLQRLQGMLAPHLLVSAMERGAAMPTSDASALYLRTCGQAANG